MPTQSNPDEARKTRRTPTGKAGRPQVPGAGKAGRPQASGAGKANPTGGSGAGDARARRPAPPLGEDDDWDTERDDPTFGRQPTEANSAGAPLKYGADEEQEAATYEPDEDPDESRAI